MLPLEIDSFEQLFTALERDRTLLPRRALTFYRGRTLVGRLTYGELLERSAELAGHLACAGVRRGDRILVLAPNRLEIPVLLLAMLRIGAVVVPLNPTAPAEDWAYIARHSDACGLVATPELRGRFEAVEAGASSSVRPELKLDVDGLFGLPGPATAPASGLANEPAVVLYTSGTTGTPKGVALCQRNLLRNGWSMALNFKMEQSTQFAVLPLYHAHALGFGLMTSLATGGHLVFTDKLDPFAWCDVIRAESAEFTSVVPSLLPMLLAARASREKVPSLRSILVSSAPLTAELARQFETKTGIPLVQGWGLSEYTNFACCMPTDAKNDDREALLFHADGTSVGSPLTGSEVMVLGNDGEPAPEGESGELCVRGHSLMLAYYRDEKATQNTMLNGWLRTGDQGHFRMRRGKPLFFVTGRIKEIIIRGGEKYSPLAIERKICTAVPELEGKLVVLGFAHKAQGEEIGAYVELLELAPDLRERLAKTIERLAVELRPKVLLHGSSPIPRTHTGKIQRRKLQPLFAAHAECRGPLKTSTVWF